jgi:hypothetical protein
MAKEQDDETTTQRMMAMKMPWGILAHYYGPLAFGLICVLMIWQFIMQPQLDAKDLDYEEHRKLILTMHDTASAMNATAATMQSTSHVLERQAEVLKEILGVVKENRTREHVSRIQP